MPDDLGQHGTSARGPAAEPGGEPGGPDGLSARAVYQAILGSLPDVTVFVFGPDLRYLMVEGLGFRHTGWTRQQLLGRRPKELVPDDTGYTDRLESYMRAALDGETHVYEMPGPRHADFHWENTVSPLRAPDGRIVGGLLVSRNVGPLRQAEADRSRSEQEAERWSQVAQSERRLRERLEFLAGIDHVLASARDRREVMRAIVAAAVPRLGDWCSIHVLMDRRDRMPSVEVGHTDPSMVQAAVDLVRAIPYDPEDDFGIAQVIRTGEPLLFTGIDPDEMEPDSPSDTPPDGETPGGVQEGVETIRRLNLTSSLIVPLAVDDVRIGVLTFSVSGNERQLDNDDVALAQALAGRVAAALENRRLSELERDIAHTLQRSLLPGRLPAVPGAEIAVRYWAAGEGTEVGGDFYDVFETAHGEYAVVVGDVCGSGPAAAAVTATARHTIRALARHGDDHAAVLRHLNDAVLTSWPDIFCTVAYATLAPTAEGIRITAVSGGHPLPVLVREDGTVSTLGEHGTLIGAFEIPDPEPVEADLRPGDTVVFFTDGAYDMPPPRYLPEAEVLALISRAAERPDANAVADAIAAQLEANVPFGDRDDDVAVVVIRVV